MLYYLVSFDHNVLRMLLLLLAGHPALHLAGFYVFIIGLHRLGFGV